MADMNCKQDLNAQLQGLEARVKAAEKSICAHVQLSLMQTLLSLPFIPTLAAVQALLTAANPIKTIVEHFSGIIDPMWYQQLLLAMEQMAVSAFDSAVSLMEAEIQGQISLLNAELASAIANNATVQQIEAISNQILGARQVLDSIANFITNQKKIGSCQTNSAQISPPAS
jgi:hypothetical protein